MTDLPAPGAVPASPSGGPATPPRVAPWLALYSLGRFAVFAAIFAAVWFAGLGGLPALLWALVLSIPASYLLLRPVRDRLTEALAARSVARKAAKEAFRARLSGTDDD
jgi:peptidoglycan/LPS O-acetylase OafA/YrhL